MPDQTEYTLVSDIGGTNTRLALCKQGTVRLEHVEIFQNEDFDGFESVLQTYIADKPLIASACLAIAGPIVGDVAKMTNLGWVFDRSRIEKILKSDKVIFINDLQSQAYALPHTSSDTLTSLYKSHKKGTKLVIGPGTGLNLACLHDLPSGDFVPPAENGHTTASAQSPEQFNALRALKPEGPTVWEDVLSGRGLPKLYAHCGGPVETSPKDILSATDEAAQKTLTLYAQFLGTYVRDQALSHLPHGGIFFIGGLARAIAPRLEGLGFYDALHTPGTYSELIKSFSLTLVQDETAGLLGCAGLMAQKI